MTGKNWLIWCLNQKGLLPSNRVPPLRQPLWVLISNCHAPYWLYLKQKDPLEDFVKIRDTILLELCCHEGLCGLAVGSSGFPLCAGCGEECGTLRYTECTVDAMYCSGCLCARHSEQPLHQIQVRSHCVCPIKVNLEVFCSSGQAHFLLHIHWPVPVLLFNLGTMGIHAQILNLISNHSQLSISLVFTWLNTTSAVAGSRKMTMWSRSCVPSGSQPQLLICRQLWRFARCVCFMHLPFKVRSMRMTSTMALYV